MISKNHVFKILLVFVLGIILARYTHVDWIIAFTIWSFILSSLLIFVYYGRSRYNLRRAVGINILLVFLSSGVLSYSATLTKNIENHYYKHFLPRDKLVGTVVEFEKGAGKYNKIIFSVEHVVNDFRKKSVEGRLLCYVEVTITNVSIGNRLFLYPQLSPIKNNNNPGEFDAETYWKTQGITEIAFLKEGDVQFLASASYFSSFWFKWREYFKGVISNYVSAENSGVASALVLGDKSSLTQEKRAVFANSGAMHVLAVSGMHVGILLGFLQFIFYSVPFLRKRNLYIYFALFIVWCFAFLTGLSASVFRAAIMFTILAIGQLRGYSFFSLNALLFSGLVLLIIDANYLFNIGFQLSFLAMLGIVFFYKSIRDLIQIKNKWLKYFWDGTAIGIAAQIGTVPISLYYFHQFPNYFIITNIGLLILAGAALISAILLFVFHLVPFVNELIGKLVDFVFYILNSFVSWINDLPFSVSRGFDPSWEHVFLLYLAIIGMLYFSSKRKLLGFRTVSFLLFILSIGLITEREMNKELQELVVFNHYNKTIVLKEKNDMYCFFNEEENSQLEKSEYLVSGYGKKMGCDITYFPIYNSKKVSLGGDVEFVTDKNGWIIKYYDQTICLVDKIDQKLDSSFITVAGSWNKYISQDYVDFTTFKSAFKLQLEQLEQID
jgi:competence protein ComEC